MLDFSSSIDLPLVWWLIILIIFFLYIILDGFDLGCGILFPFMPFNRCRDEIMNSIAPFWDGNETWLVLAGIGIFTNFPVAYAVLMPALYLPVTFMLLGLIFRGVAFEFRFKSPKREQKIWDIFFFLGSLLATFMQGIIMGNFIQGIELEEQVSSWINIFSILTGIALIFVYSLLAVTWLIIKTEKFTQKWARNIGPYILVYLSLMMIIVSILILFFNKNIKIQLNNFNLFTLLLISSIIFLIFLLLWKSFYTSSEVKPFFLTILLVLLSYILINTRLYPWIVPFKFTIWEAAGAPTSQSLLLIGVIIFSPIILTYVCYSYYVFKGKVTHKKMY